MKIKWNVLCPLVYTAALCAFLVGLAQTLLQVNPGKEQKRKKRSR